MSARKHEIRETAPEAAQSSALLELLDRYLAGDLSGAELADLEARAKAAPAFAAALRPAIALEALIRETLELCAVGATPAEVDTSCHSDTSSSSDSIGTVGSIVEESGEPALGFKAPADLSAIDRYLAGLASRAEVESELERLDRDGGMEAELQDALGFERLMATSLKRLVGATGATLSREAEQIDRMMAGDLEAAEQAEFIAHTPTGTQSGRALHQAIACSELIRDSLRLVAAGAKGRKIRSEADGQSLTLLDDLLDRSLAGALKQSEISQLAAAAESSPAAAARIRSADKYATLMQTTLARMACGSDRANELMERATRVRLPQVSHARRAAKGRLLRLSPASGARGIKIAAAAVFVLTGASAAVWALLGGLESGDGRREVVASSDRLDDRPLEGRDAGSMAVQINGGESGVEGSPPADVGSSDASTAASPTVDSSAMEQPRGAAHAASGADSSPVVAGSADASGETVHEPVVGTDHGPHAPGDTASSDVGPASGEHGSGTSTTVRTVEVLLSADALEMKYEAIDVAKRHLMALQRDDGLFSIFPEPEVASSDEGRRARRAAQRVSDEARIEDSASMQATCLRALVQALATEPNVIAAQSAGVDSLLRLAKEKQSFGLLSIRDASNVLCAVDGWYQAMARTGVGRVPTNAHSKEAAELLRFILRQQKPSGLWGHSKPQQAYGLPTNEQGLSALVGRQVDVDFATTFAAAQGIDAASRLKVRVNIAQASQKLVTAILNAQSAVGDEVSIPQLQWDPALCVAIDDGRDVSATARGWTMTGDRQGANGKPLERSGLATASALFALQVGREGLSSQDRTKRFVGQIDRSLTDGFAWLAANFDASSNPKSGESGVVSRSSQQYASLWRVAVREASARRAYSAGSGQLVLGGAAWYRSLNDTVVPMLASGMGESQTAQLDVGLKPTPSNARLGRALSIAYALLAINSKDLLLPDGRAIVE